QISPANTREGRKARSSGRDGTIAEATSPTAPTRTRASVEVTSRRPIRNQESPRGWGAKKELTRSRVACRTKKDRVYWGNVHNCRRSPRRPGRLRVELADLLPRRCVHR